MSAAEKIGRKAVGIANGVVNTTILIVLLLMMAFGCYALWDSNSVSTSAEAKQYEIFKPSENPLSFQELQAINPEVFGWITVYGTTIDYPLLQAENNSKYINTSAEGEYSLTGAIFIDYTNDRNFRDFNTIVYGHNMVPKVMFGGIKEFKEADYFENHKYGDLYYDGKNHGIELFAMMETDAYNSLVFSPGVEGKEKQQQYLDYLLEQAMHTRDLGVTTEDRIVLLSTCSAESTNGRDILIGRITEEAFYDEFTVVEKKKEITKIDGQDGQNIWNMLPLWAWIMIAILILLILLAIIYTVLRKRRKKRQRGWR